MIRHTCVNVNMADSNNSDSTSTSASDSSDLEAAGEDELAEFNVEPFQGIQPSRFEPPGRNTEPRELEEDTSDTGTETHRRRDLDSDVW